MFARLTAKAIFITAIAALAFFGVGFLGLALSIALIQWLGAAGAYALVGLLFLLPPLVCVLMLKMRARAPKPALDNGPGQALKTLLCAVARETPWAAIVAAGLAGLTRSMRKRRNSRD